MSALGGKCKIFLLTLHVPDINMTGQEKEEFLEKYKNILTLPIANLSLNLVHSPNSMSKGQ